MILRLLMLLAFVLVTVGIVNQIMLPAWRGRQLFPILDARRRRARQKLEDARAAEVEARIRVEATRVKTATTKFEVEADAQAQAELDELIQRQRDSE